MVEIGGNIEIIGFDSVEYGKLVVVKKIIGNFVKDLSCKQEFKKLILELVDDKAVKIKATLISRGERASNGEDSNLFFALNNALNGLQ